MIKSIHTKIKLLLSKIIAKYKSSKTYPDALDIDLNELFSPNRKIKVAIIDDQEFPWRDALECRDCKITHFRDYTKPLKQGNQRNRTHDLSSYDIIICDIQDVGAALFPDSQGLGVMEDLRHKLPLHVIAAYTGSPGLIYSKMKKQTTIDMVFSREWSDEDFLLNFCELTKVFTSPKNRWDFIRKRLNHLSVNESKIDEIRNHFVEGVILGRLLKTKFNFSAEQTKQLLLTSSGKLNIPTIINAGIKASEFTTFISPFFMRGAS